MPPLPKALSVERVGRRSMLQIALDRPDLIRLARLGWSPQDIAEHLSLSVQTVNRELKLARAWSEGQVQHNVEAEREEHLARLAALEKEALAAWEASKFGIEETTTTEYPDGGVERTVRVLPSPGDIGYFRALERVQQERAKVLGTYAPTRTETAARHHVTVEELHRADPRDLTDAELERLIVARNAQALKQKAEDADFEEVDDVDESD